MFNFNEHFDFNNIIDKENSDDILPSLTMWLPAMIQNPDVFFKIEDENFENVIAIQRILLTEFINYFSKHKPTDVIVEIMNAFVKVHKWVESTKYQTDESQKKYLKYTQKNTLGSLANLITEGPYEDNTVDSDTVYTSILPVDLTIYKKMLECDLSDIAQKVLFYITVADVDNCSGIIFYTDTSFYDIRDCWLDEDEFDSYALYFINEYNKDIKGELKFSADYDGKDTIFKKSAYIISTALNAFCESPIYDLATKQRDEDGYNDDYYDVD